MHDLSSGPVRPDGGHAPAVAVCADDFGLDEGVNAAVVELASAGRVQATGAMVGAAAWRSGTAALRRLRAGGVDVGLHLDFTEHPLTGRRRGLAALIAASHLGRLDGGGREAVRAEIRAQLDAFEDGMGHAPSFVDGHQHVHQLPVIREELVAELERRRGTVPPWIRSTRTRRAAAGVAGAAGWFKAATIAALGSSALDALARRAGFPQNRGLLGVYDFSGGLPRYLPLLRGWLREARDGDLLMCHPGRAATSGGATSGGALADAREAEYFALASPDFARMVGAAGLALRPMSRIVDDVPR